LGRLQAHAEQAYPEECCGALLGVVAAERVVEIALAIDNARADERRRRFLVTPDDYRRVEAEAARRGLDLLGFYHSHPDHPARPSEYDRLHALPWHSYVIVEVAGGRAGETTSWILSADRSCFESEPLATGGE
jgi:proteasome lid subunit RPN8/RPN11